jgi:hypothetical protein
MTVAVEQIDVLNNLLLQRAAQHSTSFAAATTHTASSSSRNESTADDYARRWLHGLPNELQQAVLSSIKAAWRLSVGNDSKFEGFVSNDATLGGLGGSSGIAKAAASKVQSVLLGYLNGVFRTAAHDPAVSIQLSMQVSRSATHAICKSSKDRMASTTHAIDTPCTRCLHVHGSLSCLETLLARSSRSPSVASQPQLPCFAGV